VIARINLSGAKGNHGLYIDAPARLAFIACEGNDKLLVLDLTSRKVLAAFRVAKDPDVLAFDPVLGWLYVAGESGQVSVFKVRRAAVSAVGTALLGPDAHVVAVDPVTHEAFFPLKPVHGKPVLRITRPNLQANARLRQVCPDYGVKHCCTRKKSRRGTHRCAARGWSVETCCDFACDHFEQ
jgi:hypothetical protein